MIEERIKNIAEINFLNHWDVNRLKEIKEEVWDKSFNKEVILYQGFERKINTCSCEDEITPIKLEIENLIKDPSRKNNLIQMLKKSRQEIKNKEETKLSNYLTQVQGENNTNWIRVYNEHWQYRFSKTNKETLLDAINTKNKKN
jgi:hypothetical protein